MSTSEKVVGYDVDGSTIYEKTYYSDNCSINAATVIDTDINSTTIKRITYIDGAIKDSYGQWNGTDFNTYQSGATYLKYIIINSGGVAIRASSYTVTAYHVTIRYVKN